ncbi:MAG: nucleotide exchange factor GrpE [Bacillota bacterium]|nr:nucleotide exchange factor GrpE [Bacillota bacterium]
MTKDKSVEGEDLRKDDLEDIQEDLEDQGEVLDQDGDKDQEVEEEDQSSEDKPNDLNDYKNQLLRLQADFSNYKKRVEKEKQGYIELGVKKLAIDLLPVLDNLERALKSIEDHGGDTEIFKGINMIDDQIVEVLKKHSIVEIQAEGEKFDPNLHHAVAVVEADHMDEDMVVDVFQKGYQINESVIRPSMVRVSKK